MTPSKVVAHSGSSQHMPRRKPRRFSWARLSDEKLLQVRLKDLKVTVEGTWLERCVRQLQEELEERGIRIKPHFWISEEWFSPSDTPGIAIRLDVSLDHAHTDLVPQQGQALFEETGLAGTRAAGQSHGEDAVAVEELAILLGQIAVPFQDPLFNCDYLCHPPPLCCSGAARPHP
jgi:hypothetical protein